MEPKDIAVIVPVRPCEIAKIPTLPVLANYFAKYGCHVVIALNGEGGPRLRSTLAYGNAPSWIDRDEVSVIDCGPSENPYVARNAALHRVFGEPFPAKAALLIDADCTPDISYMDELQTYIGTDRLVAGRVLTEIPKNTSKHFDRLEGFECYDGFNEPSQTIGANMVIGSEVYALVGNMDETKVSGGDIRYGKSFEDKGGVVTAASTLIVRKLIHTLTLDGIIQKQIRRAKCFHESMLKPEAHVRQDLAGALCEAGIALERGDYPAFIDKTFQVMSLYGQLSRHVDRPQD